jgi:hypothetical protein
MAVHTLSEVEVAGVAWNSVVVQVLKSVHARSEFSVPAWDSYCCSVQTVYKLQERSVNDDGDCDSYWVDPSQVVIAVQMRSENKVAGVDWYSKWLQTLNGVHCLSEVAEGGTDSNWVKRLQLGETALQDRSEEALAGAAM